MSYAKSRLNCLVVMMHALSLISNQIKGLTDDKTTASNVMASVHEGGMMTKNVRYLYAMAAVATEVNHFHVTGGKPQSSVLEIADETDAKDGSRCISTDGCAMPEAPSNQILLSMTRPFLLVLLMVTRHNFMSTLHMSEYLKASHESPNEPLESDQAHLLLEKLEQYLQA
nr:hypothetical protein [Tanacetum cinerariifolium]